MRQGYYWYQRLLRGARAPLAANDGFARTEPRDGRAEHGVVGSRTALEGPDGAALQNISIDTSPDEAATIGVPPGRRFAYSEIADCEMPSIAISWPRRRPQRARPRCKPEFREEESDRSRR